MQVTTHTAPIKLTCDTHQILLSIDTPSKHSAPDPQLQAFFKTMTFRNDKESEMTHSGQMVEDKANFLVVSKPSGQDKTSPLIGHHLAMHLIGQTAPPSCC
jgi:hypothetical protein